MRSALRNIVAVIAGFVVASVVMMIVEFLNGHVFYPGLGRAAEGVMDREVLRALLAKAPIGAMLVVIAGWTLGGVTGGWVATKLSSRPVGPALVVGGLLTLAGVINNLMIPPPIWFWIVSLAVLMPAAYVGARLASGSARA
ncbi:MAG TPA: hypothetical protein VFM84_04990 [Holophagaceae bacterium]|nr:hypothetical protein [Holophagaceae bacterium]